eukprot:3760440-Prymnesium_polylepis.1
MAPSTRSSRLPSPSSAHPPRCRRCSSASRSSSRTPRRASSWASAVRASAPCEEARSLLTFRSLAPAVRALRLPSERRGSKLTRAPESGPSQPPAPLPPAS